jgi:hypothetical protein
VGLSPKPVWTIWKAKILDYTENRTQSPQSSSQQPVALRTEISGSAIKNIQGSGRSGSILSTLMFLNQRVQNFSEISFVSPLGKDAWKEVGKIET